MRWEKTLKWPWRHHILYYKLQWCILINQCLHFPDCEFQPGKQSTGFSPLICVGQFGVIALELSDSAPRPFLHYQTESLQQWKSLEHPAIPLLQEQRVKSAGFMNYRKHRNLFNNSSNKLLCKFQVHFSNFLLVWSNVEYKLKINETNLSDENSGKDYFPLPYWNYWNSDSHREKEMLSFCSNTHYHS